MPSRLNVSSDSYKKLANIQHKILESEESKIILDFTETNYVDAIYMAFIGGLKVLSEKYSKQLIYRLRPRTKLYNYFKNSGFYEYVVKKEETYINKNSIPFSEIHSFYTTIHRNGLKAIMISLIP